MISLVPKISLSLKKKMRNPFSLSHIFLFNIALISFLQLIECTGSPLDQDSDLIENACKKTSHYDLCVSSLKTNPESSNADLRGLAKIMVSIVLANTSATLDFIQTLLRQAPNPELERSLAYCAELYIPVVKYSLPQAIEALIGGHFGFANYGVSDVLKEATDCEKKFSGSTESPLTDRNNLVKELSEVNDHYYTNTICK